MDYYGAMLVNNTSDVEFAGLDSEKTFVVRIKHDDKLNPTSDAHFQVCTRALLLQIVLLESSIVFNCLRFVTGMRRLRCCTPPCMENVAFACTRCRCDAPIK